MTRCELKNCDVRGCHKAPPCAREANRLRRWIQRWFDGRPKPLKMALIVESELLAALNGNPVPRKAQNTEGK